MVKRSFSGSGIMRECPLRFCEKFFGLFVRFTHQLFMQCILVICFFLSLVTISIDASDQMLNQPKKKSRIKSLFRIASKPPVVAQSPEQTNEGYESLDHKHNETEDLTKQSKTATMGQHRADSMWRSTNNDVDQVSPKAPKTVQQLNSNPAGDSSSVNDENVARASRVDPALFWRQNYGQTFSRPVQRLTITPPGESSLQEPDDECEVQFVQSAYINQYFKYFVSKLLPAEQEEYEKLYSFQPAQSLRSQNKAENKAFCRRQKVLRRAIAVAYSLNIEQKEKHLKEMREYRAEVTSKFEEAKTKLEQERNVWSQQMQMQRDEIIAKQRTYAFCFATAVSFSSILLAWTSLRSKFVKTTTTNSGNSF